MTAPDRPSISVADLIAAGLASMGVKTVFGVISIHNMPILDAIARQGKIRFVSARGEAGAFNMADAYARVSKHLGVVITSTGTAAGNAAGASVEALSACTPILHITSTIDRKFADRDRAAIHDVPRQPDMLKAISKAYFRIWDGNSAVGTLKAAIRTAMSAPAGPVALEIPVDAQRDMCTPMMSFAPPTIAKVQPTPRHLEMMAELISKAKRPMLWLGGGARGATEAAQALASRGIGIVTSTNGRGIVPETFGGTLGAFNMTPEAAAIYASSDLMLVVGSRLRGNETRNNEMKLPRPLFQVDADASQSCRNYASDFFVHGDAQLVLDGIVQHLPATYRADPQLHYDIAIARAKSEGALRQTLGPYQVIADTLLQKVPAGRHPWVRDVTISNSTFGNRYVHVAAPHLGVHSLGGGIGQGIPMAIGAALAEAATGGGAKTIALVGDGGAMLSLGELLTAVEERANIVFVLMNDQAYGVIQNIQDAQYGARRHYSKPKVPDFKAFAASIDLPHACVSRVEDFAASLGRALTAPGPQLLEVDMLSIGPFAQAFGGPPAGAAGGAR
jgi:acetolactate synthase I/II/III large subunit